MGSRDTPVTFHVLDFPFRAAVAVGVGVGGVGVVMIWIAGVKVAHTHTQQHISNVGKECLYLTPI